MLKLKLGDFMSKPGGKAAPKTDLSHVEAKLDSGPEAYKRFRAFTQRLVSVPKNEIDEREAKEKRRASD